ncbi:unnamed protein product [Ostreobium quekettii]|uniref:Uncharacterized protein n=1 Tax=Ostreobium quekettii TaxID=121088 RepID=A0A8S1J7R9_9CHLO|nr:unnamed protein product [Ostreobium quekettii]
MKLERLKRSTLKFLDTLDEDATGMDPQAVYEAKTTIRELVEDTTNLAEEIISRDRDAGVSPEEYDEAVTEIKWAFQNVTSLLMTAQAAAKGSDGGQHPEQNAARSELKKAMGSMKVTKEALMRLKNDHYESMKLPHLQTVKENWRGRWALALASKINKTELEERAYLGDVTKWCHGEMELQRVYRMCSFAMFWILAASAYVTFSRSFLVAARKQGGSHVHRCASANASG